MTAEHEWMLKPLVAAVEAMRNAQREWAGGSRSESLREQLKNATKKVDDMLVEIKARTR